MWILEHNGDLFDHKKLWLKPGTRHLLGRTKPSAPGEASSEHNYYIKEKSVSRRHLIISVKEVKPREAYNLGLRSSVELEDSSMVGTYLDGDKFFKSSRSLHGDEHEIKLGNWEQVFRIKWYPVVLCYTFFSKDFKNGRDPLEPYRTRLELLDVKLTIDYVPDKVTHVIANKRNTPKGLQALVHGRHIVTDSFVDALVDVATPKTAGRNTDDLLQAPLELDFTHNWPKELNYLPTVGKEPVPRPAQAFAPDPSRAEIFAGYTFVFCDESQYKQLSGPINGGKGKALLYDVVPGTTAVNDFVRFVKDTAGEKGNGELEDANTGNGVVVVRHPGAKGFAEWVENFVQTSDLRLNQRSLPQNEFLDIIVTNDTNSLRRQLEEEVLVSSSIPQPPPTRDTTEVPMTQEPALGSQETSRQRGQSSEAPPGKRRALRALTTSRFKGFDDFDPSQVPKTNFYEDDDTSMADIPESQTISSPPRLNPGTLQTQQAEGSSRKRSVHDISENDHDVVEGLLPAAAAMKKRRLEDGNFGKSKPTSKQGSGASASNLFKAKAKEIDVLGIARTRREAEEEAARIEAESLQNAMEDMDIAALRNLVKIEEIEVKPRTDRSALRDAVRSERWDDRWNGRKNFKKFRRQGTTTPMRGQRVIVMLEEVKKKDYGIGEEYWLEGSSAPRSTRDTQMSLENQRRPDTFENSEMSFPSRSRRSQRTLENEPEDNYTIPKESIEPVSSNAISERTNEAQQSGTRRTTRSQSVLSDTQGTRASRTKRPAATASARAPAPKRPRATPTVREEDNSDSSDDELKFRFRRRR